MKIKIISMLLIIITQIAYLKAQDELFDNELKLKKCELDFNIVGYSKTSEQDYEIAKELEDIELVWIQIDKKVKKSKISDPIRVYLITEKIDGLDVEYIILATEYDGWKNGKKFTQAYFPDKWNNKKKHRFYRASCYDKVIINK